MSHVPKVELGIRNWSSSTGSLIEIFKYVKVRGRNKKQEWNVRLRLPYFNILRSHLFLSILLIIHKMASLREALDSKLLKLLYFISKAFKLEMCKRTVRSRLCYIWENGCKSSFISWFIGVDQRIWTIQHFH